MKAIDLILKGEAREEFDQAQRLYQQRVADEVLALLVGVGLAIVELAFPKGASLVNRFVRLGENTFRADIDTENGRVVFKQAEVHYDEAGKLIFFEFNSENPVVWKNTTLEKFMNDNVKFFTQRIFVNTTKELAELIAYGYGGVTLNTFEEHQITGRGTVFSFSLKENGVDPKDLKCGVKIFTKQGVYVTTAVEMMRTGFGNGYKDNVGLVVRKIETHETAQ